MCLCRVCKICPSEDGIASRLDMGNSTFFLCLSHCNHAIWKNSRRKCLMSTQLDHISYGFMQLLFHDIFHPQNDKIEFSHGEHFFCEESFFCFYLSQKSFVLVTWTSYNQSLSGKFWSIPDYKFSSVYLLVNPIWMPCNFCEHIGHALLMTNFLSLEAF